MEVYRLLSDELSFELEIRGISSGDGTVREKRRLLKDAFRLEREGKLVVTAEIDDLCLPICKAKLEELSGRIQDFDLENRDNEYKSIKTRLLHVQGRLSRIRADTAETQLNRDTLIEKCSTFLSELERVYISQSQLENISSFENSVQNHDQNAAPFTDPPKSSVSSPAHADVQVANLLNQNNDDQTNIPERDAQHPHEVQNQPQHGVDYDEPINHLSRVFSRMLDRLDNVGHRNSHNSGSPIKNFGLYFDGSNMSFSCFLERVEELRISRGYTKDQLLNSAPEIFRNEALSWFRSVRRDVGNWDDLLSKMRRVFLPSDYDLQLWRQLEKRTQHPDEKVVFYIATIQNYFNKFNSPPSEIDRVAFIRRNLLPAFQTALAMRDIGSWRRIASVNELIDACQVIEEANLSASNYQPPPTTMRNPLEPELLFRRAPTHPRVAEISLPHVSEESSHKFWVHSSANLPSALAPTHVFQTPVEAVQLSKNVGIKCWNCGKVGHRQQNCSEPRRLHCFKCGKPDVTVRSCPSCSGNQESNQ